MLTTLPIVLPLFALILLGYVCRKTRLMSQHASTELNRFVVYLALPAAMFDITANTTWTEFYQPGFIATFGLSSALVFVVTLGMRLRRSHLADASIDGLNAAYSNSGYMGLPLCLLVFGKAALAPSLGAMILTVCMVFACAIVLIEVGLQSEARPHEIGIKVLRSLAKNPLLVAPALGALFASTGGTLPVSVEAFLKLLGNAASPCALVALGLFLAQGTTSASQDGWATTLLVTFKLILHPVVAWLLASYVFELSPLLTHIAVVFAALPTGTGPFMLAEYYRREAAVTSKTILISTMVSVLTLSLYLAHVT